VPEDESSGYSNFLSLLSGKKSGVDGVRKDQDGKVSPYLTANEVARYEKIFGIMKKVVNPGPETGSVERTDKMSKVAQIKEKVKASKGGSGGGIPGLGELAGLGLAAGVIGAAFTELGEDLQKKIEGVAQEIVDFGEAAGMEILKLPIIAGKIAGKLGLKLGVKGALKMLKPLPVIGALANFWFAYDHYSNGEIVAGTWELLSGIVNFLPGGAFVSPLMDGYKIFAEIAAAKQTEETGEEVGFSDILGQHIGKLYDWFIDKVQQGYVPGLSAMYKIGEGLGALIAGDVPEAIRCFLLVGPAMLGQGNKDAPLMKGLRWIGSMVKEKGPGVVSKGKEMAEDAWGWMKQIFEDISLIFGDFFEGIMSWVDSTMVAGKNKIIDIVNLLPGINVERAVSTRKPKATISASATAEGFMQTNQFKQMSSRDQNAWMKKNGFIEDGFISKDGSVTAFDDQDDILAAKRGGPISKLLDQNSAEMKAIATINAQQLNVLVEIRDGINALKGGNETLSFSNTSLTQEFFE
jgi:hypothetical protein